MSQPVVWGCERVVSFGRERKEGGAVRAVAFGTALRGLSLASQSVRHLVMVHGQFLLLPPEPALQLEQSGPVLAEPLEPLANVVVPPFSVTEPPMASPPLPAFKLLHSSAQSKLPPLPPVAVSVPLLMVTEPVMAVPPDPP